MIVCTKIAVVALITRQALLATFKRVIYSYHISIYNLV